MNLDRLHSRRKAPHWRKAPDSRLKAIGGAVPRALWQDRRGAVALLFGIAAIPMLMLIGMAVDFAFISQARAQLEVAADTAALTAAKVAGQAFVAALTTAPTPISQGQTAGTNWFAAQVGTIPNTTLACPTTCATDPTVTVVQSGNSFTATVNYTAEVKSMFQALFGISYTTISNSSQAKIVANAYVDVTFLLDNSSSMLIAASNSGTGSANGVTTLQPLTAASSCFQATVNSTGTKNTAGGFLTASPWIPTNYTSTYNGGITSKTGLPTATGKTGTSYCDFSDIGAQTCTQGTTVISSMSNTTYGINGLQGCQCAFACHWVNNVSGSNFTSNGQTYSLDYYGIARAAGVQLRFDVVQSAVEVAIQYMQTTELANNVTSQFGAAVFEFNNSFTQVWPPTGDTATQATSDMACLEAPAPSGSTCTTGAGYALSAAQAITTPVVYDTGDTNFPAAMTALTALSTAAGDGSTQTKPKKSLIIVTDGIQDWGGRSMVNGYSLSAGTASNPNGAEGPISMEDCTAIKALGYTVYVLYTTYYTSPTTLVINNETLENYVPGSTGIYDLEYNMQNCASSPQNFVTASNPAAITAAVQAMVQAAINNGARLTL